MVCVCVCVYFIIVFVYSCSYEALESDEEKGSDNESDVSKLLIVCLVILCEISVMMNYRC